MIESISIETFASSIRVPSKMARFIFITSYSSSSSLFDSLILIILVSEQLRIKSLGGEESVNLRGNDGGENFQDTKHFLLFLASYSAFTGLRTKSLSQDDRRQNDDKISTVNVSP